MISGASLAAIGSVMAILLVFCCRAVVYLAFGSRKIQAAPPACRSVETHVGGGGRPCHGGGAGATARPRRWACRIPSAYESLVIHADGHESLEALRRLIDGAILMLEISTFLFADVLVTKSAHAFSKKRVMGSRFVC